VSCDVCGAQEVRTRFCEACGVDFCADCALGAHDVMHELAADEYERMQRWVE
jgi:primosomal protein N'